MADVPSRRGTARRGPRGGGLQHPTHEVRGTDAAALVSEEHEVIVSGLALVANLPVTWPHAARVISDPDAIGDYLVGDDLRLFHDHRRAVAAIHLVLTRETDRCFVILRRDRRKDIPLFASVLHVGNPAMLRRRMGDLGQHLLLHHGLPFTLIETRLIGGRPHGAVLVSSPRPKMFRSTRVPAERIDNMYSELALVAG